jgi:hypothetical protein
MPIEAESHGFCNRCPRFTIRVTPDHARLASGCSHALPGGIGYPQGHDERFQFSCSSSFPKLTWRDPKLPISPRRPSCPIACPPFHLAPRPATLRTRPASYSNCYQLDHVQRDAQLAHDLHVLQGDACIGDDCVEVREVREPGRAHAAELVGVSKEDAGLR